MQAEVKGQFWSWCTCTFTATSSSTPFYSSLKIIDQQIPPHCTRRQLLLLLLQGRWGQLLKSIWECRAAAGWEGKGTRTL